MGWRVQPIRTALKDSATSYGKPEKSLQNILTSSSSSSSLFSFLLISLFSSHFRCVEDGMEISGTDGKISLVSRDCYDRSWQPMKREEASALASQQSSLLFSSLLSRWESCFRSISRLLFGHVLNCFKFRQKSQTTNNQKKERNP